MSKKTIVSFLKLKTLFILAVGISFVFPVVASAHEGLHEQIVAVTEKIRSSPKDSALYLKRAELYRLHKEWNNAEADLLRAERLTPNLPAVDLGRGKLWLDAKQFSRARLALTKYLARQPDSFEGVITIARVFAKLRQTANAAKYFTQAIKLAPNDSAEVYLERAEIFTAAGKIDEALHGLDEGIKKLGGIITLQSSAVDLEVKRGRYDLALNRLDKIMESMPRKESFLLRRGEILLQAGKPCEARFSLIASQNGYDTLPASRKNVRAVRTQVMRVQSLLKTASTKNCPISP